MKWLSSVFFGVVYLGLLLSLGRILLRKIRNRPVKAWVQSQPMTYSTGAFVRERRLGAWTDWSHRYKGGPHMIVRTLGIDVSAPQGMVLASRAIYMTAAKAYMSVDNVGWAGTRFGRRECIRLIGKDAGCEVDLAIIPDSDFKLAWKALVDAGVQLNAAE